MVIPEHYLDNFQVLGFLTDIFSFQSADFNTASSLSESVMMLARTRLTVVKERLGCGGPVS